MERLSPIDEDNTDPSGRSAPYEDLPLVTSKVRTLPDTTQRQNAENAMLRKQLMAFKNRENKLNERVQELEELTATLFDSVGRNPTEKTANKTSTFNPRAAIPSNPLDLTLRIPRPQDVAYQEALKKAKAKEKDQTLQEVTQSQIEKGVLKIFSQLARALTESHNSFTLQKWGRKDKDSEATECDNKMNAENDDETNDEEDDKTQEQSNDSDTSEDEKDYNMTAGNKGNSSRSENEPEQRDQTESNPKANPQDQRAPNSTPNASANRTKEPNPKPDTNLFVDEVRRPPKSSSNNNSSDNLAFRTGRRQRGTIKTYTPNPFEELNEEEEPDNEAEQDRLARKAAPNKDPDKEQPRYACR